MRIATYQWNGQRHAGIVAEDGQSLSPLKLSPEQARTGALAVIERSGDISELAERHGAPLSLRDVKLEAPLPVPRRNIFWVGRNYYAHAKELSDSVFKNNSANPESWPIVFTKVPECVIGYRHRLQAAMLHLGRRSHPHRNRRHRFHREPFCLMPERLTPHASPTLSVEMATHGRHLEHRFTANSPPRKTAP